MGDSVEDWDWSQWLPFPDPSDHGILRAPFGPGLYQLRNAKTGEYVVFGKGKNLAYRMTSLLPIPFGQGTRKNTRKRDYVLDNLINIKYRTVALKNTSKLKTLESELKNSQHYLFNS
ncbi:hypothetical protein [Salinimicrobium soli]|uniref:hypothetical protein n=1 Tax=Salinimicrobium soli TaxID=1254399 RepID=UPI003AAD59A4